MKVVEAEAGERIDVFLKRAIVISRNSYSALIAVFNDTDVAVYPDSCLRDLGEKYDMQRQIYQLRKGK